MTGFGLDLAQVWAQVAGATLVVAAVAKLIEPEPAGEVLERFRLPRSAVLVRFLALSEFAVAGFWLVRPSSLSGGLLALSYVALSVVVSVALLVEDEAVPCGCLGSSDARFGLTHLLFNLVGVAAIAVLLIMQRFPDWSALTTFEQIEYALLLVLGTYLAYLMLTRLEQAMQAYGSATRRVQGQSTLDGSRRS